MCRHQNKYVTWDQAKAELLKTAEALERLSHLCRKSVLLPGIERAEHAEELAKRCRRLARKTLTLPGVYGDPRDKDVLLLIMFERLRDEAHELMNLTP